MHWFSTQLAAVIVAIIAIVVLGTLVTIPSIYGANGLVFGQTGLVASLAAVGAVIGAFVAWQQTIDNRTTANQTLAQARRLEIANRFQRAGELLADGSPVLARAGLTMLDELIRQPEGEQYVLPAAQMLLAAASTRDRATKDLLNLFDVPLVPNPDARWPRSDPATGWCLRSAVPIIQALVAVGRHRPLLRDEDRINVEDLYITATTLPGWTANRIHLLRTYLGGVTFQDCEFTGSRFNCAVAQTLVFRNCTLDDVELELWDAQGQEIFINRLGAIVTFEGGSRRNLTCWGIQVPF